MTNESEDIDDIPEGDGPYETGLWAEARHWVGWLINIYGNVREIALVGLTRHTALRCMNWLWSIEGIVRRLILAAALALDPKDLPALARAKARSRRQQPANAPAEAPPEESGEPRRPPSTFRLFALRGASFAPARTPPAPEAAPPRKPTSEHRHLVFPADSLLLLGPADARRPAKRLAARRPHPLDRRGRLSRWDPGYKTDLKKEEESYRRHFFGPFPRLPDRFSRPPRERKHRDIHDPYYRGPNHRGEGGMEWRRIADEWERVIPAPSLAGRIMAIHRVMANPQRWIERAARFLRRRADLAALLRDAPYPNLVKPKRDRGPAPPGQLCLSLCHVKLLGLDTS